MEKLIFDTEIITQYANIIRAAIEGFNVVNQNLGETNSLKRAKQFILSLGADNVSNPDYDGFEHASITLNNFTFNLTIGYKNRIEMSSVVYVSPQVGYDTIGKNIVFYTK